MKISPDKSKVITKKIIAIIHISVMYLLLKLPSKMDIGKDGYNKTKKNIKIVISTNILKKGKVLFKVFIIFVLAIIVIFPLVGQGYEFIIHILGKCAL